jgi:hypothetical protein
LPLVKERSGETPGYEFDSDIICTGDASGGFHWYPNLKSTIPPEEEVLFTMISDGCDWVAVIDNNRPHTQRVLFNGRELHCLYRIPLKTTRITCIKNSTKREFILTFDGHQKTTSRGFNCGYCRLPVQSGETVIQKKGVEYHEPCYEEFKAL